MAIVYLIYKIEKDCTCGDPECGGISVDWESKRKNQWTESVLHAKQYPTRGHAVDAINVHLDKFRSEGKEEVFLNIETFFKP